MAGSRTGTGAGNVQDALLYQKIRTCSKSKRMECVKGTQEPTPKSYN
jgi:hypothetical protein